MRLYSLVGAISHHDPEYGTFEAEPDGGFLFPDDLSDRLHRFHVDRRPMWETEIERQQRLATEELERRRDPKTLLDTVEQLMRIAAQGSRVQAADPGLPEPDVAKRPGRPRRAAAA